MADFAVLRGISILELDKVLNGNMDEFITKVKPETDATFQACQTASEWNSAARLTFPSISSGDSSAADTARLAFCLIETDPKPSACSNG
jgi:hypothetical protein